MILTLVRIMRGIVVLAAFLAFLINAGAVPPPTFWTGPNTNYAQTPAGQTSGTGVDNMTAGFGFTRPIQSRPFNAITESFATSASPADSEWANATPATLANLSAATNLTYHPFVTWAEAFGTGHLTGVVNQPGVLHLINENIYISIEFSSWAMRGAGFAYTRSTPAVAAPTPAVSITNPANNATFTAPANVSIMACASVSSGSVTNVKFFANTNSLLGSANAAPFTITASNLAAGSYALTAVATAAGVSGTSAVVNITVSAPVAPTVSITSPAGGAVFSAPANLNLAANASVSGGTVTNVAFFNGLTLLGSAKSSPFSITASNLTAGAYALNAVATAAGVSSTSAVVNVSIVTPVAVSSSTPVVDIDSGHFSFSYSANQGLTYVVQSSPDLMSWSPIATNVAAGSTVLFTAPFNATINQYYRVVLLPNP